MSYDLHFWREIQPGEKTAAELISTHLTDDGPSELVASWPEDQVKKLFKEHFPTIVDAGRCLWWEGESGGFNVEVLYSEGKNVKLITVLCGYKLLESEEIMSAIIDIGTDLGCGLYDPQIGKRFEQPS